MMARRLACWMEACQFELVQELADTWNCPFGHHRIRLSLGGDKLEFITQKVTELELGQNPGLLSPIGRLPRDVKKLGAKRLKTRKKLPLSSRTKQA